MIKNKQYRTNPFCQETKTKSNFSQWYQKGKISPMVKWSCTINVVLPHGVKLGINHCHLIKENRSVRPRHTRKHTNTSVRPRHTRQHTNRSTRTEAHTKKKTGHLYYVPKGNRTSYSKISSKPARQLDIHRSRALDDG